VLENHRGSTKGSPFEIRAGKARQVQSVEEAFRASPGVDAESEEAGCSEDEDLGRPEVVEADEAGLGSRVAVRMAEGLQPSALAGLGEVEREGTAV
jgi:hypothetical protein